MYVKRNISELMNFKSELVYKLGVLARYSTEILQKIGINIKTYKTCAYLYITVHY